MRAGQPSSWDQPAKGSVPDPFTDHLSRRWAEGCHNAARLWREIRALGFAGQTATSWVPKTDHWGNAVIHVKFPVRACTHCPARAQFTQAKASPRNLTF